MLSSPTSLSVAIGELLWDLLPSGPRLGGTTTNFGVFSARLGEFAALVSCVGDDALGREAIDRLIALANDVDTQPGAKPHLELSEIQISNRLPTGTVSVLLDDQGRPQYTVNSPVAWDSITLTPSLSKLAGETAVICFGTLAQREVESREAIRTFIQAAGPSCVRVCDLNLRAPFNSAEIIRWSIAHADILKVSDEELPEVARLLGEPTIASGFPHNATDELRRTDVANWAASRLLELAPQCRLVAITLGPHGSFLADRCNGHRHTGVPVRVVDTVGAGDAFTAGLVHAHLRGGSLSQMSEVANLCGSYVAGQPGATPRLSPALAASIRVALS